MVNAMEENNYKNIFEIAQIGLATISVNGKILAVNTFLKNSLGYPTEKILQCKLKDLCLDEEKSKIENKLDAIRKGIKNNFSLVINIVNEDGSVKLTNINASLNSNEDPQNLVIVFKDLSKQIQYENELKSERIVVEAIMDNLPDAVFFKDLEGRFTKVNKALLRKHGFQNEEEIIGKTDFDLFEFEHANQAFEDEKRVIGTRETIKGYREKENWPDGRISWSLTSRLPLIEEGNVIGTFGVSRNVTETVLAEEKVMQTMEELRLVNENKDKFFSIISHDLKSPFNGLLGITEILDAEYDELSLVEIKEMIQIIRHLSLNVYDLLEGLLQWAQTQTGRMEYNFEGINVFEKSSKVVELLTANAINKNIVINNNINIDTFVFADSRATNTVFRNLIANAIKFTKKGGVITIGSYQRDNDVVISITDSGVGMSAETIQKLFRIEVQHTTVGTNNESGTGVGLILCKELVENQNGKIWVESELGRGSKFYFSLPLYKAD
jgi:PAS domain S-box-containing protein